MASTDLNVTMAVDTEKVTVRGLTHIKREFQEDFLDEIEDCNKYLDMAAEAEAAKMDQLTQGLYAIAWDEYTHARFIHGYLVDWGFTIPDNELLKWHELRERVDRKFHRK